ncbi:hypothetical protein SAMN05444397_10336 [Flavobacterium aquidurense]|uniref:Lumazine-binding n=1 Tax=Flavobacterium frigidimaris TaxID=262320 RepID=A0ABX4BUF5_FLAFR|nr:hypothetical protein [Flavobacterium frigidimaris]OXA81286.1 hypothetical protein B0A65_03265 [Flavobacterium frigidimaris]SDZ00227.1 hypothetical protein SAMN05444397_10336 [Flavobacterium aquidurense]
MKKIILYIVIIFAFSNCQNKKEETNIASEEIKNINEIVEAIIIQDSLNVFSKSPDSIMFCSQLRRLNIYIPEKRHDGLTPPAPPRGIYITSLLSDKIIGEKFSTQDSLGLLQQNSNPEKLKIENSLIHKLKTTTVEKALKRRKNTKMFRFYEMTIPVFSLDRKNAYVKLDYYCTGLCGSGKAIYLKKLNGKWKIIEKRETWIS